MIVITVELWPGGRESQKRTLATATITNDGTGTKTTGNYRYKLSGANGTPMKKGIGRVLGFARKRKHVWELTHAVLQNIYSPEVSTHGKV